MTNVLHSFRALGPGLIWAAAAIGVSHLVQSTRAGAMYGFALVAFVILVNVLKYPFFEYGPRYAAATGESLLSGYKRMGNWAYYLFLLLTLGTMFAIQSAVTIVTAGLFSYVLAPSISIPSWTLILLGVSALIVYVGRFRLLDQFVKVIIILLSIATVVAVIASVWRYEPTIAQDLTSFKWELGDVAFLIALAGWMPSAIDISVWHSFWTLEKKNKDGQRPTVRESLFDFKVGFITTIVLSLSFLALGALVLHGSGQELSENGTQFSAQFIQLYTDTIGDWAFYLIALAALATMFSTTLTVLDAYPRVLQASYELFPRKSEKKTKSNLSILWILILVVGSYAIIRYFAHSMRWLVDLATTISFLTAPILGYLNLRAVTAAHVPEADRPKRGLIILSWIGLISLALFGIIFLVWRFFW